MSTSMGSMAVAIRCRNSGRSCGRGGTYTASFTYPHRIRSQGVRSGDLGGQLRNARSLAVARPVQRRGRFHSGNAGLHCDNWVVPHLVGISIELRD
jgi:hypothetical protein